MSALVRKLLNKNLQNIVVIAIAFGFYLVALYFDFPVLLQLGIIAGLLLAFLQVSEDVPS